MDVTGQMVRELFAGSMGAGAHSLIWKGRDDRGIAVSSGVYFSRLQMGEQVEAKRMMLVR